MELWKYPEMHITSLPLPRNKFIWPSYLFQTHFFFSFQNKSVVLNTSQERLSMCLLYLHVLWVSLLISVCVSVSEYLKAYGLQATETISGWLKPINDLLEETWGSSQNQKKCLENLTLRRKETREVSENCNYYAPFSTICDEGDWTSTIFHHGIIWFKIQIPGTGYLTGLPHMCRS